MHEEGNTGLRVAEVGLCVNLPLPHLGASLDRVIFDPMSNDKFGGVEIKPNSKAGSMGLSITQTVGHPSFIVNHFWFQNMGKLCKTLVIHTIINFRVSWAFLYSHGLTLWDFQA